jgi:hydrogenase large subunit
LPRGAIVGGKFSDIHNVDLRDPEEIQEFVTHSWYKYPDETKGLHPWDGITDPHYELGPKTKGTKTAIDSLDEDGKYSWIKSPRWKGHAMELGPLSRWTVGYAQNKAEFKDPVDKFLKDLGLPLPALFSTLGRTAARALESQWAGYQMRHFYEKLIATIKAGDSSTANVEKWDPKTWPAEVKGVGFSEAPRGALGHWIKIKNGRIDNYQAVVPTTWNGSPRDPKGNIGAFEASLMNTPMADPEQPLEILRTLHSFDPCLACSTHVMSEDGQEMAEVRVR